MNLPVVTDIFYNMTCRVCGQNIRYGNEGFRVTSEEIEVRIHTLLDESGWVDGQCPKCVEKLPSGNPDREYDEAAEGLLV